jgi:phytanoyl-CoA hydroxylase|tara:strand:- start:266 stop:1021 length:756 start_codon:yes stop_codon:yes gene_type:complete
MEKQSALVRTFYDDGFLKIPSFFNAAELAEIEKNLGRFVRELIPSLAPAEVFYEDKNLSGSLKQIQRMHEHDSFFFNLFHEKPKRLAEKLLGEAVVAKNLQFFNKPPALSQATPPHQDAFYFKLEPCSALTMWMALDVVDKKNGCVRYVKGSHKNGLRSHRKTQTLGFSQGISDFGTEVDRSDEVICSAQPGELLVHHAMTIHRAEPNTSNTRSRRALGFIFYGESALEDVKANREYKQKLEGELTATGKI